MQVTMSTTFAAPPPAVFDLLVDPQFQAEKARRLSSTEFDMDVHGDDLRTTVVTRRKMSTSRMPEFVRALVDPSIVVKETEAWDTGSLPDDEFSGSFFLEITGAPVRMEGTVAISRHESGSRLIYEGELTATVPLFRDRIAEAAAGSVTRTISVEFELLEEILAGQASSPISSPGAQAVPA